ncbi:MAG: SGNH/GDSL hydrolase family protein [Rhizobacter sp.]
MVSFAKKLVLAPVLFAQARSTRKRTPALPEAAGPREGQVGSGAHALRVLIAGDSSAAGVGVLNQDHAFAGHFTRTLHRRSGRAVRWRLRAKSGLTTKQVHELLRADPPPVADIAIVLTGVNDVIDLVTPQRAVQHRAELADWLIGEGRARYVLFAPLPPINQFPLLPQPLRGVMGAEARLHDEAMAKWAATKPNVFHTPIALQLAPAAMSRDGFHPGEPVYRACGESLARFVVDTILPMET